MLGNIFKIRILKLFLNLFFKVRAESYDNWTTKVRAALEAKGGERMDFVDLKKMFTEASDNKYPESELLEALQLTVEVNYYQLIIN